MSAARQLETDPALELYRGGTLVTVGHFKPGQRVPEWRDLVIIEAPHMPELDRKSFQRGIAYKLLEWWDETQADQDRLKHYVTGYRSMLPPPSHKTIAAPVTEAAPALQLVQDKPAPKKQSAAKRGRPVEISRDETGKLIF